MQSFLRVSLSVLLAASKLLHRVNGTILAVGRWIGVTALAIMVCLILGQVFFRYVLNDAPNWTEEGARFGMLWMSGLMAPLAYRTGGFVAIEMVGQALPKMIAGVLGLILLALSLWVLCVLWDRGLNNHVDSLSGRGCSTTLRWPFGIEIGKCGAKFANNYQYASLWVGMSLLILVNIELMIRQVVSLLGSELRLPRIDAVAVGGAD
ncbi:TRAP transporter small permease [Albirhodobacter sp. R86504]|uniref:TRAP transporter small permease n=1 Tax=Albirhodobacter sp. R86504 TaxID=3093848 RepID=UPI0036721CA7